MNKDISKAQTFRNVIYNFLLRGARLICQLLASTVVQRGLSAADVGVVGFASIIIGFLNQFSDCGVGNAVIRRPQLSQHNLESAFTLKLVLGAVAFGAALLIAPFAWHFCDHPAAGNVTRLLALNFFISTIGFLPLIQLTREMNFRALMVPGLINSVVRCVLAVTLVWHGWKFWAVAVADVGANLASGVATQYVRKIPLRWRFDVADMREYLRFGLPLLGTGLLIFLILNLANFMISVKLGITQLGYYTVAFTWGSFICGLLAETVNRVLFPTFAALQNDLEKMRRWYLKTTDLVAFFAVVANTTLLANTHAFLVICLGKGTDKWIPAATTLQILCCYGIIRAITEPIGNLLMARNQTKTLLHACIVAGVVQIVLLLAAVHTGMLEWVAVAVLVAYATQVFVYVPFLRREVSVSLWDLIKQLWPVAPAMLAGWWATHALFQSPDGTLFTLAGRALFTAVVTALVHGIFSGFRCVREVWELTFQKFANSILKNKAPKAI